jgi:hypothetical protein
VGLHSTLRKEERGKRKEERGKRKEERGKRKEDASENSFFSLLCISPLFSLHARVG